jgi:uncharacterized membrane protein YoaK (UPF0700 family)
MTGALVRFGQGLASWLRGRAREGWLSNLALWLSLASGAVCGALAATLIPWCSAWLAMILALCLFFSALWVEWTVPSQSI